MILTSLFWAAALYVEDIVTVSAAADPAGFMPVTPTSKNTIIQIDTKT